MAWGLRIFFRTIYHAELIPCPRAQNKIIVRIYFKSDLTEYMYPKTFCKVQADSLQIFTKSLVCSSVP
jgi:hypothetical protein